MKLFGYLLFPLFAILSSPTFMSVTSRNEVISCAPAAAQFRATISTVQSGNWSDPATWGGHLPSASDAPVISTGHTIFADTDATIAGMQVNGILFFDPAKSVTITSTKNILINGLLQMAPANSTLHSIRFTGIDETKFGGGGMDPLASDIGLWVMGAGRLTLQGAEKKSWTNATGAITSGATTISVKDATGWKVGDSILITPTAAGASNYDTRSITGITGNTITLNASATSHPLINNRWTAEVGNLTRNVRIEGTAAGRAHVFIRSTAKQTIKNVGFRFLGPRKDVNNDGITDLVLGRYGLHFHHCDNGSVGSIVDGCVMRDLGNHAYVPHVSNGITMSNNIAFNCLETPFWWDFVDPSHDIKWLHNLVALPTYIFHSVFDADGSTELGVNGFVLGSGDDNICNDNTVVGQSGLETTNAAYDWEEIPNESAWEFKNNVAHNNDVGLRTWQNSTKVHVIENSTLYNNNVFAIFHGAYANMYRYVAGSVYHNPIQIKAASGSTIRLRFENLNIDAAGMDYAVTMEEGPLNGPVPIFFRNCTITGATKAQVLDRNPGPGLKSADFVQCNVSAPDFAVDKSALKTEVLRIQPVTGQPIKITKSGKSNITAFAPAVWGDGTGLTTEYYTNKFGSLIFKRIEPTVNLPDITDVLFHHKLTSYNYSIRWSGLVMPQYSQDYNFYVEAGGGVRLWVNDKLIIDKWEEFYPALLTSSKVSLIAGQKYNIRLEYFNEDDRSEVNLLWSSSSLPKEYIPQSQLFPNPLISLPLNEPTPVTRARTVSSLQVQTVVKDVIIVKSPSNLIYQIYDVLGRNLRTGKVLKGNNSLPAPAGRGVFILKFENGEVRKIIKP
jgi:hypothetical protein